MTNLEEKELKSQLLFLCNPTKPVLEKEEKKKPDFGAGEKLKVNLAFTYTNVRISFVPP